MCDAIVNLAVNGKCTNLSEGKELGSGKRLAKVYIVLAFVLIGCGGGKSVPSDSGGNNVSPTVDAGEDQVVIEQTNIVLSGFASDSDGSIQSFRWEQVGGTAAVELAGINDAAATFLAPAINESEILIFRLQVTDDDGATASDTVEVSVSPQSDVSQAILDQVLITYPVDGAVIDVISPQLRAEVPDFLDVSHVSLLVDGIELVNVSDFEDIAFEWPAYFIADGEPHNLLLQIGVGEVVEFRDNEQITVTVDSTLVDQFTLSSPVPAIQDEDRIDISLTTIPFATHYEVAYSREGAGDVGLIMSDVPSVALTELSVGVYELRYRGVIDNEDGQIIEGPWSSPLGFEVLPAALPNVNSPVIAQIESGYQVTLSWRVIDNTENYIVSWGVDGDMSSSQTVIGESVVFNVDSLEGLSWQIQRTNGFSQLSEVSDVAAVYPVDEISQSIQIAELAEGNVITEPVTPLTLNITDTFIINEAVLYVDGVQIDTDTAFPWSFNLPAYYFADGEAHDVVVRVTTDLGVDVDSDVFSLMVDTSLRNSLSFAEGVNGTQIQDIDTFAITLSDYPSVNHYEVSYGNRVIETTDVNVQLTNLDVGIYDVRYRAVLVDMSLNEVVGPWNDAVNIEVLAPELPTVHAPSYQWVDDHYDVTFSWEPISDQDAYEIYWVEDSVEQTIAVSSGSTFQVIEAQAGEYEWALRRINHLGQASEKSDYDDLAIGVFRAQFGGTGNDRVFQSLQLGNGDYLVLGGTRSSDITPSTDNQEDPWILRVSPRGELLYQAVISGDDTSLVSVIEGSDGSIYLAGLDFIRKDAVLIKLNASLEESWRLNYKPEGITSRFDFRSLTELNGRIVTVGHQWNDEESDREAVWLHEINMETGQVMEDHPSPEITGYSYNYVTAIFSIDNKLYLCGAIQDFYPNEGPFLIELDSEFNKTNEWNNFGQFKQTNIGYVNILPGNRVVISGQSWGGSEPATSIVDLNSFDEVEFWSNPSGGVSSPTPGIVNTFNDNLVMIFSSGIQQGSTDYSVVVEFSDSLVELRRFNLVEENASIHENNILGNVDGTYTAFYRLTQSGNTDIVVRRLRLSEE